MHVAVLHRTQTAILLCILIMCSEHCICATRGVMMSGKGLQACLPWNIMLIHIVKHRDLLSKATSFSTVVLM